MTADGAGTTPGCRVVFEPGSEGGVVAHLYPVDANAYALAQAVAVVRPDQEIPRTPFADVAHVSGATRPGESVELVFADGTRLVPDGPLHGPTSRIFAERSPGVILHPSITGNVASWRHARSLASTEPASWEAHLVRERRVALVSLVLGLALLVGFVVLLSAGLVGGQLVVLGGTALLAGVAAFVQAGRGLRALASGRRAQRAPPARMRMRLWWSVGAGSGPVAMASLAPISATNPEDAALHLEVVNVPNRFEPPAWDEVDVFGDVVNGGAPVIKSGEVELWPAGALRPIRGKWPWWTRLADG